MSFCYFRSTSFVNNIITTPAFFFHTSNYDKTYTIENPQVVATDAGNYVILFERYKKYSYQGVYAIVVDANGNVVQKTKKLASSAYLNPSRMPVYSQGKVWWAGNKTKGTAIYIYSYAVK